MTVGHVSLEGDATHVRITLSGEVDVTARDQIKRVLGDRRLYDGTASVDVDASAVAFIDSTGLGFLARLVAMAEGRVRLVAASPSVLELLSVTHLGDALPLTADA